jgi:hypothetical protein
MNKKQALAVMDAHIIPVAAERQRRLQKRKRIMLRLYPALKRARAEERAELFQEARRYALSHWAAFTVLGITLSAATYLLREQIFGAASEIPTPVLLLLIPMAVVPGAVLYAQIRGYLGLLLGSKYERDDEVASQRSSSAA